MSELMMETIRRIKPADVPFSPDLPDAAIDRMVKIKAFDAVDGEFRNSSAFRRILKFHARLVSCETGDIVIREGDWGNSAFFVASGSLAVFIGTDRYDVTDAFGRPTERKTFWDALAQLWKRRPFPEFRGVQSYFAGEGVGRRGSGQQTQIYLQDVPAVMEEFQLATIGAGELFGELSALGRTARTTTVFAKEKTELIELRWQGLRDILRRDPSFRARIERGFSENALRDFLRRSPLFDHLEIDGPTMSELVEQAKLETYGEYDRAGTFREVADRGQANNLANEPLIAKEGDYPNSVIFIRSGLARVSQRYHQGHRTYSYLTPGRIYGLEEIASGWWTKAPTPLRFSLRAVGHLTVVSVPARLIERIVLDRANLSPLVRNLRRRLDADSRPDPSSIDQNLVEFLVQERFINGTASMLIDLDRCTRCDDCVRACAQTHDGNPRFVRQGSVHDNIMVTNACMHCQDPVCMIECPTGAIGRSLDEGEVVINDPTCIGCGACAKNCPYDAIRMVEIRDVSGNFIRDKTTSAHTPISKATKCDLCIDQFGGPACQRACPHDALLRVDMGNVPALAQWLNR